MHLVDLAADELHAPSIRLCIVRGVLRARIGLDGGVAQELARSDVIPILQDVFHPGLGEVRGMFRGFERSSRPGPLLARAFYL